MAINPNSLLSLAWDPPSVPQYATCDAIVPGFIFGGDYILPIVDRYEVELFNPVLNEYVNQGYFYTNAADLKVNDVEDAKVRIRAITRDGFKSEWAESGILSLYGFTAIFSDTRNTVFLSFV
jgi:hypothetical protein